MCNVLCTWYSVITYILYCYTVILYTDYTCRSYRLRNLKFEAKLSAIAVTLSYSQIHPLQSLRNLSSSLSVRWRHSHRGHHRVSAMRTSPRISKDQTFPKQLTCHWRHVTTSSPESRVRRVGSLKQFQFQFQSEEKAWDFFNFIFDFDFRLYFNCRFLWPHSPAPRLPTSKMQEPAGGELWTNKSWRRPMLVKRTAGWPLPHQETYHMPASRKTGSWICWGSLSRILRRCTLTWNYSDSKV